MNDSAKTLTSAVSTPTAWALVVAAVLGCQHDERRAAPAPSAPATIAVATTSSSDPDDVTGQRVTLRATKPQGVPVHDAPESSRVSFRLAHGSEVIVRERRADGRWLRVHAADGRSGWITRRYVMPDAPTRREQSAASRSTPVGPAGQGQNPWASRAACEALVASGVRLAKPAGQARVVSWNVRWFPHGGPGAPARGRPGTDVSWLACALAYLDPDVVALQEFKSDARARRRTQQLVAALDRWTGGTFRIELDRCPSDGRQHVGLLFDARRVVAEAVHVLPALNPRGRACEERHRPGLSGYFRFPGGFDAHIVSVHLKSGDDERSFRLRQASFAGLHTRQAELLQQDGDLIVAGDYNPHGCDSCAGPLSAAGELEQLSRKLAALPSRMQFVPSDLACTEYSGRGRARLDLFAVTAMAELLPDARVRVEGHCQELACRAARATPAAAAALSDHCPIVLDFRDRDLD